MKKTGFSKNFYRLAVLLGILPLIAAAGVYGLTSERLIAADLVVPVIAYALMLACLGGLISLFHKKNTIYAAHFEKFRDDLHRRHSELNALKEISELTRNVLAAEELLSFILEKAMSVVGVRNGSVFLVDSSVPEGLRLVASKPEIVISKDEDPKRPRFSFVKSVIESGKAMLIQNVESDPRTKKTNDPKYGSPSFISMPVYKNNSVIAVMNLANKEDGGIFTESDERILTIMLGAIGVGMENISLHHKVEEQAAEIADLESNLRNRQKKAS